MFHNCLLAELFVMSVVVVEALDVANVPQDVNKAFTTVRYERTEANFTCPVSVNLQPMEGLLQELTILIKNTNELLKVERPKSGITEELMMKGECTAPFLAVGTCCVLLEMGLQMTWIDARIHCADKGGDLVMFENAQQYQDVLDFIGRINRERSRSDIWIGGSDSATEGTWLWVNGAVMPRGPPFWGSNDGYAPEPGGGSNQNCAILWFPDRYYIHDHRCDYTAVPLCQKFPTVPPLSPL